MIPIKIADKKYSVRPISELTTSEFLELMKIENLDIIKYIAWQTKTKFNDAFFTVTSIAVEKAIGRVPDITKLAKSKKFNYELTINTVGQRHQIESSNLTGYELLVFVLAVSQAHSNNIDDVYKLRDEYLKMSFKEVLPAGFFFFRTLHPGKNFVARSLKKLAGLIKIKNLKKVQV